MLRNRQYTRSSQRERRERRIGANEKQGMVWQEKTYHNDDLGDGVGVLHFGSWLEGEGREGRRKRREKRR